MELVPYTLGVFFMSSFKLVEGQYIGFRSWAPSHSLELVVKSGRRVKGTLHMIMGICVSLLQQLVSDITSFGYSKKDIKKA